MCADSGADENNMYMSVLMAIEGKGANIAVDKLKRPRVFEVATATEDRKRAFLTCTSMVSVDTELKYPMALLSLSAN